MGLKTAIQLYAVRDSYEADKIKCLKAIKKMGYDGIELCGWGGVDPNWVRGACDALGLEIPSMHISLWGMSDDPHGFAEKARILGIKYAALPSLSSENDFPGQRNFNMIKNEIRKVNSELSKVGVTILYHNHDAEFDKEKKINGEFLFDVLLGSFRKEELCGEIDTCWSHLMGIDPALHIEKYGDRIPVVHLKDYVMKGRGKNKVFSTCPFGDGNVNALDVIKSASKAGSSWLVVEEDNPFPSGKTELECAEKSIKNIRKLLKEAE